MKKIFAAGILTALFAVAGPAFAAINIGLDQSANAAINLSGSSSSSGSSANASISGNATADGNANTGTLTIVRGNLDSMNINQSASGASNANMVSNDGDRNELESEIQSQVSESARNGQWSAQTRARIISKIHAALSRAGNWSDEYDSDTHINLDGSMDASSSNTY